MKMFLNLLFLFLGLSSFAQKQFVFDEYATLRTLSQPFTSIKVNSAIQLYLTYSENIVMAISTGSGKQNDAVKSTIENGELTIYYQGANNYNAKAPITVYLGYNSLTNIECTDAATLAVVGVLALPTLHIRLSGASSFKGNVDVGALTVRCTGASNMQLKGRANNMVVDCTGASDLLGYDCLADTAIVKTSGASDVKLSVGKILTAVASGASTIYYKGSPILGDTKSNGASTIAKKD